MNLSKFSKFVEIMYSDKMTVYRMTTTTNDDGTINTEPSETPIYEDIKCRVSTSNQDDPESNTEDVNPQYIEIKVFCSTEYQIKKGDKIVASRIQDDGTTLITYQGTANLPLVFVTHKEILLVDVGVA